MESQHWFKRVCVSKVLVIGASRGIGKAVSEAVAASGRDVRAMSRSGQISHQHRERIESFAGDALKSQDVEAALDGVETVVQALGVAASPQMVLGPVTLFSDATCVLLPAMEKVGVKRLIAVTGFGAGDSAGAVNLLQKIPFCAILGRAYDDKSKQEDLIQASALDWLIVRPGILTDGSATGRYSILEASDTWRNGIISRADVADYIASECSSPELGCKKPVLIRYPL